MRLQKQLGLDQAPLFLMDGSAFIFRGFYANRSLTRSDGFPTNALYMVTRLLLRILRQEKPSEFVFVLDGRGKNFRHEMFPLYKANRDATPEELVLQLDPIKRVVKHLGLTLEVSEGCEADDCIASLAKKYSATRPVIIIGADKDLRQCLNPKVWLWDPAGKEEKLLSMNDFVQNTGLQPEQWPDVQALIGDTSDNIPGIPGIGPKTAEKIFMDFRSLEDIRDGLDRLPPKMHAKIAPHVEDMFLYRKLTTLGTHFCTELTEEHLRIQPIIPQEISSFLQEFELDSLRREAESMLKAHILKAAEDAPSLHSMENVSATSAGQEQASLFGTQQGSLLQAPEKTPEIPRIENVAALPPCHDQELSILPTIFYPSMRHEKGFILGLNAQEWHVENLDATRLLPWIRRAKRIITPDIKYLMREDAHWLQLPLNLCFDLGLAAYLLSPEDRDYSFARLSTYWRERLRLVPKAPALLALDMAKALEQKLQEQELTPLYSHLEMPLIPVLAHMEHEGIAVNPKAFAAFLHDVQNDLNKRTEEVYAAAGKTFNIRSAQQLGDVLFSTLNLPSSGKTKGGQLSTAQEKLEKLAGNPIVDAVLEFRKLEKLRSTYLEPLPKLADAKGRIHSQFNQWATATGRLSSSNPNLQNIPVRGPLGQRMRSCFVPKEGHALLSADYSQVELRVLAHMSKDPVLLEAFKHGKDIHTSTASLIYGVGLESVTSDQRRNAKTINFGLIYGMGAQKLAQELHISTNEAKDFIANYFKHLGQLKLFYEQIEHNAKEQGYVLTMAGRRRLVPDIHSTNGQKYALARRQAINTVIQGSAADIIKLAMLAVHKDATLHQLNATLTLQIHDELLLEVPKDNAKEAGERVAAIMSQVRPSNEDLRVPLLVDWGIGDNWGEAH